MCGFLSVVSNGRVGTPDGKLLYFDWSLRRKCLSGELSYNPDSHASIANYFGYKGVREDELNKYEYNPLTKKFTIDQLNTTDDSKSVREKCQQLDFGLIVPELIIKPIINPFEIAPPEIATKHIKSLREWASVRGSSVWASVWDSVWGSSVWASVRASVRDSSVWGSVWDSVRGSVGYSSVGDSVWAYIIGSFFKLDNWEGSEHRPGQYPFSSCVQLWDVGLVPSFDGTTWKLHGGKNAKVLFEISNNELFNM